MPTYEITAPDGKNYRIDGPPGASQEQVVAAILGQTPNAGQPSAAPTAPPPLEGSEIGRGFRTGWENVKNSPDRSALLTSASQAEANKRLLGLYDKVDAGKKPEEANSWLYDALASGAPSTATGDMLRPSDKDLEDRLFARLQAAYAEASPAERKALRAATDKDYKKAIAGVGEGVEAVAKAQTKNAPNRGTVENRSDIKNASDAWKWLEYNVGAGAAQYGPVAAAAFLSPNKLAPVTALGTSSYMALGAGVEQRLAAIGEAVKDLPKDEQTKVISKSKLLNSPPLPCSVRLRELSKSP